MTLAANDVVAHVGRADAGRTFYIDRLRVCLTGLVIAHHSAITYGGSGGWFYKDVQDGSTLTSQLLTVFCAVNQSFFMGFFFLLAGYFTPASLARKGARQYVQDRLLRLGLPLLVFGLALGPLTVALAATVDGAPLFDTFGRLLSEGAFIHGPLWFAQALLIFSLAYLVWARRPSAGSREAQALPGHLAIFTAGVLVGAAALLIRQLVPVGQDVAGMQLGYFASYVFLFALGCTAARGRWLDRFDAGTARSWGLVSLLSIPLLFIVMAAAARSGGAVNVHGGLSVPAVTYAFWEPMVAWGIILSLLVLFRARFNSQSALWDALSSRAYAAFVVHAPVLVTVSLALRPWAAPAALKFAVAAALAIVLSFAVAGAMLRLPSARRVL